MHKGKLIAFAIAAVACSSTPTSFAGTYTITIVDGANTCNFANWTAGNSTANISATITQDGTDAQLTIPTNTLVGAYLELVLGSNSFQGSVKGNEFTAEVLGMESGGTAPCKYTVNTTLDVTIDTNNVLSGTLTYTPATNNDPSCGVLNACSNAQTVSGSRTSN